MTNKKKNKKSKIQSNESVEKGNKFINFLKKNKSQIIVGIIIGLIVAYVYNITTSYYNEITSDKPQLTVV
ncbi:MAG: hypothetical protein JSV92_03630, partial [archaeon]